MRYFFPQFFEKNLHSRSRKMNKRQHVCWGINAICFGYIEIDLWISELWKKRQKFRCLRFWDHNFNKTSCLEIPRPQPFRTQRVVKVDIFVIQKIEVFHISSIFWWATRQNPLFSTTFLRFFDDFEDQISA